jgi:ABC-2 type transport system ATP-binding protein
MTLTEHCTRITFRDVEVYYATHPALRCNELDLETSICGIIGPNGAGKSTFIKTILGLLRPIRGEFGAYSVTKSGLHKLVPQIDMAYCPEMGAVFNDISVEEYLLFWCRLRHGGAKYLKFGNGKHLLDALDLWAILPKRGAFLSKGEKQRVQTCAGFLLNPKLFLFDEPFDGLDVQRTQDLVNLIQLKLSETSFIISSHRMDIIERIARSLLVLNQGKIVSSGTVTEVSTALAGEAIILTLQSEDRNNREKVAQYLTTSFPHTIITDRGTEWSLTGSGLTAKELAQYFSTRFSHFEVMGHPPSLTDAMTLYLRSILRST